MEEILARPGRRIAPELPELGKLVYVRKPSVTRSVSIQTLLGKTALESRSDHLQPSYSIRVGSLHCVPLLQLVGPSCNPWRNSLQRKRMILKLFSNRVPPRSTATAWNGDFLRPIAKRPRDVGYMYPIRLNRRDPKI